jgi:hypothetical protein
MTRIVDKFSRVNWFVPTMKRPLPTREEKRIPVVSPRENLFRSYYHRSKNTVSDAFSADVQICSLRSGKVTTLKRLISKK